MPDHNTTPPFGKILRALREERRLTLDEAGRKSRLSPNYIGDVERGVRNPTLKVAARILAGLRVTWAEFGVRVDEADTISEEPGKLDPTA
jgi:transcriptional regulator with XRE-family HTH domain